MVIPLNQINPGQHAKIVFIANNGPMAGRLFDLGFVPGSVLSCVLQKKRRNIAAYLVRSAVIALPTEDSRLIMVELLEKEGL